MDAILRQDGLECTLINEPKQVTLKWIDYVAPSRILVKGYVKNLVRALGSLDLGG